MAKRKLAIETLERVCGRLLEELVGVVGIVGQNAKTEQYETSARRVHDEFNTTRSAVNDLFWKEKWIDDFFDFIPNYLHRVVPGEDYIEPFPTMEDRTHFKRLTGSARATCKTTVSDLLKVAARPAAPRW